MANQIAAAFPELTVDTEKNVLTLENPDGERFIVTVETMYRNTNLDPLPE